MMKDGLLSQLLSDALDSLKLTEHNRRIAEQYLESAEKSDLSSDGAFGLLEQIEYQDFALLTGTEREACLDWCQKLREQKQAEGLLSGYVKFTAAVGGASAVCVLIRNRNEDWLQRWINREQRAAFRAEMYAHEASALQQGRVSVLFSAGRKNPQVLIRAMELCRGREDASKMLLAGIWLCCISLNETPDEKTQAVSGWLEQRILEHLPEIFGGNTLPAAELSALQSYVRESRPDTPFPTEIRKILRGRQSGEDLLALLTGCAYLSLEHRESFRSALKLLAAVDMESNRSCVLTVCRFLADAEWFRRHRRFLLEELPVPPAVWARWSIRERQDDIWQSVLIKAPDAAREAAESLSLWDYDRLMERTRRAAPALYRQIHDPEQYRQKTAEELVTNFKTNKEIAEKYLLHEAKLDQILPFVKEWRKNASGYYGNKNNRLELLRDDPQMRRLYRRAVVMEGLLMHGAWFRFYMFRNTSGFGTLLTTDEIAQMFQIFQEEQVPAAYQLDTLSCIHECCYKAEDQEAFLRTCVEALDQRIGRWGEEYKKAAVNGAAMTRIYCILTMDRHWQEYKDALLHCAFDSSKQVQQVLLSVYAGHREWEPEVRAMLASGKQKERQMAVWVLKEWGVEQYRQELTEAFQREKNKKLSEYLEKLLGAERKAVDLEQLAKDCLKNGGRQKVQWAFREPYDKIHTKGGMEMPEEYLKAVMACYALMEVPGIRKDAEKLADALDPAELSVCMQELFRRWLEAGAEAKKKWVLYAVSIHGGEAAVSLLYQQIKELPGRCRGALAAEAVKALTLNGSSAALLLVDQISRTFKYRQVKRGAAAALAGAAAQLGISREELEDRIVPDLGFDRNAEQTFDYGPRAFTVRLTPGLETEVYGENGKRLKNLPSPGKQDDPEKAAGAVHAFRQMKKQLKTVAAGQKLRLEQALMTGRYWQAAGWKELFVNHPVMHPFAAGLIWGVYEDGALKETFRYMEDGSFHTREEERFAFPEKGLIGLVHPVELSGEERSAWMELLSDYEITQPVEQLARPVFCPAEEEPARTELARFKGKLVNALSLSGRLIRQGWNKGPVGDNGEYRTFYREDGKTGVRLSFSGCGITGENMEAAVYGAVFYRPGTDAECRGREEICLLGEVSPRYFSEIVLQLTQAVGEEAGHQKEEG